MALVLDGDNGIIGVLATNTDGDVIFDTNTLFVDAVENKVGIGTNSPTNTLHVNSGTNNTAALFQSTDTEVVLEFTDSAGTAYLKASGDYIKMGATPSDSLTILYGGNVGIGAANPVEKLQVDGSFKVGNLKIQDANGGRIGFNRNTANGDIYDSNFAAFQINGAYAGADFMAVEAYTSGGVGTTAMVIGDNGNVGIGTTDLSSYGAQLNVKMSGGSNNAIIASINSTTSGTRRHIDFFDGSSTSRKGAIETNGTGTTYNTTSDRRLKDNIQPIEDAIDKLMDMKPVIHTWINNPESPQVHGFIAQEMQEVAPEAVSGDAESDEMMSMDYGRITPVIVAALQDALNEIKELKTRIDELENI